MFGVVASSLVGRKIMQTPISRPHRSCATGVGGSADIIHAIVHVLIVLPFEITARALFVIGGVLVSVFAGGLIGYFLCIGHDWYKEVC
jgi:hypothetical protein